LQFTAKNGNLPHFSNEEEAEEMYLIACEIVKKINENTMEEEGVLKLKEVDKDLCYNVARYSRA